MKGYQPTEAEQQAKEQARQMLPTYLQGKGINTRHSFHCLNGSAHKNNDKNPSMSMKADKDGIPKVHCFGCGFSGDIFDVIGLEYGLSGKDVFDKAYEVLGISNTWSKAESERLADKDKIPSQKVQKVIPKPIQTAPQEEPTDYSRYLQECETRLEKTDYHRGISIETLRYFHCGYDESYKTKSFEKDAFCEMSMLIIPTGDGKHSYIARNTNPQAMKKDRLRVSKGSQKQMLNAEALNEDYLAIIVAEGEIDAMSIYDVAKDYGGTAIGLGSVSNTRKFLEALSNAQKHNTIYLSLDNDEAGQRATTEIIEGAEKLGVHCKAVNISGNHKDANEALQADRATFSQQVQEVINMKYNQYISTSAGAGLADLMQDIQNHKNDKPYATGFSELDKVLDGGMYEGLYAVGGGTSAGKTTLILQIVDNVAKQGYDVLYESLEMGKHELMARSISRETALYCMAQKINIANAKTTRGILSGNRYEHYSEKEMGVINGAMEAYQEYATHIYYREGVGKITVEAMRGRVEKHIEITGNKPLLVVDYLQIMASHDARASDKANTDYNVICLKQISRDFHIPVIVISSFNRANYKTEVDFESFKESGGIDYGCDVILGMQNRGQGKEGYDSKQAKAKNPRDIEVFVLKNRNGATGEKIDFRYYTRFNYFVGLAK